MANDLRLLTERVNLRVQLLSLVFAIVGIALMFVSPAVRDAGYHKSATLMEESGAALFISGVLAVLWELAGKRGFADEILAKANMSRDLAEAGIDVAVYSFKDERIRWDQLFKSACKLDLFVAYGHTWRNTHSEKIDKLLSDADAKIRVILPDPAAEELVLALSVRFQMDAEIVKQEIGEAIKFFERKRKKAKGKIELYVTRIVPTFTFYRFSGKLVFALYNHREGQQAVPSFVCDKEGFLFKFFSDEFEGILIDKRTRPVEAAPSGAKNA